MKSLINLVPAVALALALPACTSEEVADDSEFDAVYTEAGELALDGKDDSLKIGRFETFTGRDGKTYFHLLAANGQKVLHSQGYVSKQGASKGVETVRFNGQFADSFQLKQARDGQWYFNLLAGNWEIIGTSELYATKSSAERGLANVVSLVQGANLGAAARRATFQVFRGLDGQYYFHLRAGNGEIVLQSQGYSRRTSAVNGTASVRSHGTSVARYQVRDAADGQAYFVLVAVNGQVIGVSETYATRSNAERAVSAVADLVRGTTIAQAE